MSLSPPRPGAPRGVIHPQILVVLAARFFSSLDACCNSRVKKTFLPRLAQKSTGQRKMEYAYRDVEKKDKQCQEFGF